MRHSLWAIPTLVLLLVGCDGIFYTPSGEHRVSKSPPDTSTVYLDVVDDTIEAWGRVRLEFSVDPKGNRFRDAYVFIGEEQVDRVRNVDAFEFNSWEYEDGTHPFRAVFVLESGAESLAARLGAEGQVFEWSGTIAIDNSTPDPVDMVSAEQEEGALRLSWKRVPRGRIGFQSYDIYKTYSRGRQGVQVGRIQDPAQTVYEDTTFVGGLGIYSVRARASGNRSERGETITYSHPLPTMRPPTYQSEGRVRLTWPANPFAKAFSGVELLRKAVGIYGEGPEEVVREVTEPEDTAFATTHTLFGARYDYWIETEPHPSAPIYTESRNPTVKRRVTVGDSAAWSARRAHYLASQDAYVVPKADPDGSAGQLLRYDADSKRLEAEGDLAAVPEDHTIRQQFSIHPNEKTGYRYGGNIIHSYDLQSMGRINTYNLNDFVSDRYEIARIWIGRNDRLFVKFNIHVEPTTYADHAFMIMDLEAMEEIVRFSYFEEGEVRPDDYARMLDVAPSGKYANLRLSSDQSPAVYRVTSDTINYVGDWFGGTMLSKTFPDGPNHIAKYKKADGIVEVFRLSDLSKTRTLSIASGLSDFRYDPKTDQFGGLNSRGDKEGTYRVFSPDGRLQHEIAVFGRSRYEWTAGTLWTGPLYRDVNRP